MKKHEDSVHVPEDEDFSTDILDDPTETATDNPSFRALILKVKSRVRWFRSISVASERLKKLQEEKTRQVL